MRAFCTEEHGHLFVSFEKQASWNRDMFFMFVDDWYKQIEGEYNIRSYPVVFNLADLTQIDSMFTSLLVRVAQLTAPARSSIINAQPDARRLLSLLGVDRLLDVYDTKEEWLARIGPAS